jgi:hypothetical protein
MLSPSYALDFWTRYSGSVRWVWAAGPSKCSITSILHFCSVLVLVVCLACHVRCAACSLLASIVSQISIYQATGLPVRNALNPRVNSSSVASADKIWAATTEESLRQQPGKACDSTGPCCCTKHERRTAAIDTKSSCPCRSCELDLAGGRALVSILQQPCWAFCRAWTQLRDWDREGRGNPSFALRWLSEITMLTLSETK